MRLCKRGITDVHVLEASGQRVYGYATNGIRSRRGSDQWDGGRQAARRARRTVTVAEYDGRGGNSVVIDDVSNIRDRAASRCLLGAVETVTHDPDHQSN